jgi:hypothetical protein
MSIQEKPINFAGSVPYFRERSQTYIIAHGKYHITTICIAKVNAYKSIISRGFLCCSNVCQNTLRKSVSLAGNWNMEKMFCVSLIKISSKTLGIIVIDSRFRFSHKLLLLRNKGQNKQAIIM